jgi:DNA-binding winged helix-turn-helix (wHTH) protein
MLNDSPKDFYEFESFHVDARRRLLFHEGRPVHVTPKAFDILLGLVRSGGRVISKDELMTTIWPNCFVEEGNLAQNIFLLRRVLGERKNEHKYIITIPGVGYRFAPYVRESAVSPAIRKVAPRGERNQREGEHLRLSIQLVGAASGTMLWAANFDVDLANLFALQDSLSEQVANALAEKLGNLDQPRLSVVRQSRKADLRRCS